jgi:hypothetical protein
VSQHEQLTSRYRGCTWPPNTASKQGKGKCPPAQKKPVEEERDKPAHLTTKEWVAFNIAEEHKYTMAFERYIC